MFRNKVRVRQGYIKQICVAALIVCGLWGCGDDNDAPDISGVKLELNTRRLDKDLYAIDTTNIPAGLASLHQKYPDFLNFYLDTLLGFGVNGNFNDTNQAIIHGVKSFLTHKDYRGLFDTVAVHYPDTKKIDAELTKGFKYVKTYFPDYQVPKVVYLISGLNNWGAFTYGDDILGVGLDMFLGESYPFYRSVGIPDYMSNKLNREYLPVAAFRAVYQESAPFKPEDKNLLDMMIQRGKELYFLKKVLPGIDEHVLLAFSKEQLEWCEKNEGLVYNFFVQQKLLYDTNWQHILRYVNDGPTSAGMPAESPGNIGSWMGMRMVEAFAAEHPDKGLKQIVETATEPQVFLQQSKYKPK